MDRRLIGGSARHASFPFFTPLAHRRSFSPATNNNNKHAQAMSSLRERGRVVGRASPSQESGPPRPACRPSLRRCDLPTPPRRPPRIAPLDSSTVFPHTLRSRRRLLYPHHNSIARPRFDAAPLTSAGAATQSDTSDWPPPDVQAANRLVLAAASDRHLLYKPDMRQELLSPVPVLRDDQ